MTLRELLWYADGRDREAWQHTAQVLGQLWEVTRPIRQFFAGAKVPILGANDFNPFGAGKRPAGQPPAKKVSFKDQTRAMAPAFEVRKE
jgi:hypothetical protein